MNPQFADKCIARWNRNLPSHAGSILHATAGILLELREFRKSTSEGNGKEELGDLLYFVHMIWHDIGRPELETAGDIVAGSLDDAIYTLAEEAKRYAVYWTPEKDSLLRLQVHAALNDLNKGFAQNFVAATIRDAMEANDRKLTARYGGATFVAEKATERDLDKEMAALAAPPRPGSGDGSDDLADHNAAQADEGH